MPKIPTSILYLIPPSLVIFGYGGMVCMNPNGSLARINKSFNNFDRY